MKPSYRYLYGLLICQNCGMLLSDENGKPYPDDIAARCRAGTCGDLLPTAIDGCYVSRRSIVEIEADLP